MPQENIGKTVLLSSLLTILILVGALYGFRQQIISYVVSVLDAHLETPATQNVFVAASEDRIVETIAAANPAVVSVVITKEVPVYERYYEDYDPFGGWFGGGFSVPRLRQNGTEEREVGGGTGFVVSDDGLVVTNRHVVADTNATYNLVTNEGVSYTATVVARDPLLDIAILQIDDRAATGSLPHLTFADSDQLRLGQTVIAIGNALAEFNNSVSVGIVSGLARSIVAGDGRGASEQLEEVIQTDAAINPGNSGGPLLNLAGEVIGVNVAASLGAENIGFALPANVVKRVVASVKEYGEIRRPYLGVRYVMVDERVVAANNLPVTYGALIVRGESREELAVVPGSPAANADLREGDIILAIDGTRLDTVSLATMLRDKEIDETITLTVWRNGEESTVEVVLEPLSE